MSALSHPSQAPLAPTPKKRKRPSIFSKSELRTLRIIWGTIGAGLIIAFVQVYRMLEVRRGLQGAHFRVDFQPLIESSFVIQAHVAGAIASFVLGFLIMLQGKGSRMHRQLGWAWVATMLVTSVASLFVQTSGSFSWIHGFSAVTLLVLPVAVAAARAHKAKTHARFMTGLFVAGMLGAGLFTFLPGRLMWDMFFTV